MQPSSRTRALIFAPLLALLAAQANAQAQQPTPRPADSDEVVRVTTELVQTDVTVIDRDGNFVDGLRADQFELKVDGRPQPILFFERIAAGSRSETAQLAAARGPSAGGASAAGSVPLDRGRTVLVFLDDAHLSAASVVQTRKMLLRFVDDELRQNDQMLVAAASGQIGFLQQLTDDRAVLRAAVSRLSARETATRDFESPQMSVVQALAIKDGDPTVVGAFVDLTLRENPSFSGLPPETARALAEQLVRRRAFSLVEAANFSAARMLDSLRGLLRASAQFPGRKVLYFISDGFAADTGGSDLLDRLRRVADAAVRSGVVIYTVDARGLSAALSGMQAATSFGGSDASGRLSGVNLSETALTQTPLRQLAGDTGGRAILNTNALGAAIGRTLKETSVYYLLAWRPAPEEGRAARFRRIEVAVAGRPDLTVLAQRGFYTSPPDGAPTPQQGAPAVAAPATPNAAQQATREMLAALRAPLPRAGVPTALTLNYAKTREGAVTLTASVQVEIEATPPTASAPAPTDRVEVVLAFYDAHGKVIKNFQRGVNITPRAGDTPSKTHSVTLTIQEPVQPGLYQVRAASRDPKNRRTGSDLQWIEIPDFSRGRFALSSIFLGGRPQASASGAAPPLLVVADRRFPRETKLRFLVYVYHATLGGDGRPDVALQLQAFRDDQPVVTTPLRKVDTEGLTDFTLIPYAAEFSLANLPAGRYTLQLTAIDRLSKSSAAQRVKFTIE